MKHNLKNRPLVDKWGSWEDLKKWFEGFEAELREIIDRLKYGCDLDCPLAKNLEKEILGDSMTKKTDYSSMVSVEKEVFGE